MGTTPETAETKAAYVRTADGTFYRIGGGGGGGSGIPEVYGQPEVPNVGVAALWVDTDSVVTEEEADGGDEVAIGPEEPASHPDLWVHTSAEETTSEPASPTPPVMTALELWLDGRDPLASGTAPTDTDVVSYWWDKSGSGHVIQAGGTSPYYEPVSGGLLCNQNMQLTAMSDFTAPEFVTLHVCIALTTLPVSGTIGIGGHDDSLGSHSTYLMFAGSDWMYHAHHADSEYGLSHAAELVPDDQMHVWTFRRGPTDNSTTIFLDGVEVDSDPDADTFTAAVRPFLTWKPAGSGSVIAGTQYSVLLYSESQTDTQVADVSAWLLDRHAASTTFTTTPPSLTGLQIWLDGADVNGDGTNPADGADVINWMDKSGNGNDPFSSFTPNPTYSASDENRGVVFNGTDEQVLGVAFDATVEVTAYYHVTGIGSEISYRHGLTLAESSVLFGVQQNNPSQPVEAIAAYNYAGSQSYREYHDLDAPNKHVWCMTRNAAGVLTLYKDGVEVTPTGSSNDAGPYPGLTPASLQLGAALSGNPFDGCIHSVLQYDVCHNPGLVLQTSDWLATGAYSPIPPEPTPTLSTGVLKFWDTVSGTYQPLTGGGAGGSAVLDGMGPPDPLLGTDGAYYVDTLNQNLHGPKGPEGPLPPVTVFGITTPEYSSWDSGSTIGTFGLEIKFLTAGTITALRYYRSPGNTGSTSMLSLWADDGGLMRYTIISDGPDEGWYSVNGLDPVVVDKGQVVRVAFDSTSAHQVVFLDLPEPYFVANMQVRRGCAFFGELTPGTPIYPAENYDLTAFLVDVVFEANPGAWPLAMGDYVKLDGGGEIVGALDIHDQFTDGDVTRHIRSFTSASGDEFGSGSSGTFSGSGYTSEFDLGIQLGMGPYVGGSVAASDTESGISYRTAFFVDATFGGIQSESGPYNAYVRTTASEDEGVALVGLYAEDGAGGSATVEVSSSSVFLSGESISADNTSISDVGEPVNDTDAATKGYVDGAVGGGGLQTRTTATITTASLAADASESGTVTLAAGYRLMSITTNRPARVRLYTTAAKRDADVARAIGTDPTGDHGLVVELLTTASVLSADLSPTVDGFDGAATPTGAIPYHITNKDSVTGIVVCDFKWLRTE